jgi:ubiquinone/menaquinone biosynthesis C-methylase UbiE
VEAPYDAIADWYDQNVESAPLYTEVVLPSLVSLADQVGGREICDLACGQGFASRALARLGARVTGIDISTRLLGLALAYEAREPLGIRYLEDDAQQLRQIADASVDGVTCCMALMNIPDLGACAAAVRRVLKPSGWFVATITHPCFQTPHSHWIAGPDGDIRRAVDGYFAERFWRSHNPQGVRGRVGEEHRMLSTYVNTFSAAGFALERLHEPQASGRRLDQAPGEREVPSILSLRFQRTA